MKINEKALILILAAIQFTHILDFMIIMPLGSTFMREFGISPQQFSLIVSAYTGSAFLSGLLGATIMDRFDRKNALLVCFAGFAVGTLLCGLAPGYILLLAARCMAGAFGGLLASLILSIVSDVVPFERRGKAIGLVMTGFSVASVVGVPVGIYIAAKFTWHWTFLAIGFIALILMVLSKIFMPPIRIHLDNSGYTRKTGAQVFGSIAADPNQRNALLFNMLLILGHFSIVPFIAPYMQFNVGFSDYQITYVYAVGGILTSFLLPAFGWLSDRFGHAQVFVVASFFALFSIYAVTNLPAVSIPLALVATSSFFVVATGRNVPATTLITSVVTPEQRGSFMSVRASINELSLFLASIISGFIVVKNQDNSLGHYHLLGYFAIGMSVIAAVFVFVLKPLKNG